MPPESLLTRMLKTIFSAVSVILFMPLFHGEKVEDGPKTNKKPTIVSQVPFTKEQCKDRENDPLGCNGVNAVIENLNFRQVVATLNCGGLSEEVDVTLPARTRLYVAIDMDLPGTCSVKSWK